MPRSKSTHIGRKVINIRSAGRKLKCSSRFDFNPTPCLSPQLETHRKRCMPHEVSVASCEVLTFRSRLDFFAPAECATRRPAESSGKAACRTVELRQRDRNGGATHPSVAERSPDHALQHNFCPPGFSCVARDVFGPRDSRRCNRKQVASNAARSEQ